MTKKHIYIYKTKTQEVFADLLPKTFLKALQLSSD